MSIIVEQGQITVNSVDLIGSGRDFRVYQIDCRSKYPVLLGYSDREVLLFADEHTLKADRDAMATRITFPDIPEGWEILPDEHGRYSMRFAFYRPLKERRLIWDRPYDAESEAQEE